MPAGLGVSVTIRILYVEDDESTSRAMLRWLGRRAEVVHVDNLRDAINMLESRPEGFDLVITDWTFPVDPGTAAMGGAGEMVVDTARELRQLPVIVTSGESPPDSWVHEYADVPWLVKPNVLDGVSDKIKALSKK